MSIVFQQSCTGTDGTSIASISPEVGSNLVNVDGAGFAQDITSNYARRTGTANVCIVRTNQTITSADYTVRATFKQITTEAGRVVRLAGRWVDKNNHYQVAYVASTGNIRLRKNVGGTLTLIGSAYSFTPTTSQDYLLEFIMSGSSLSVKLDGSTIISGTDTEYSAAGAAAWYIEGTNGTSGATTGVHMRQYEVQLAAGGASNAPRSVFYHLQGMR